MRILVVRLREIGDVVFTTPAVTALRAHYPNAFLGYLVEPHAAPVLVGNPCIDELIVAPPRSQGARGWRAEYALIRRLRRHRFDLVLDFHGGPRASLFTRLTGAPIRIGYEVTGRSWMYTTRVHRPGGLRPRHSVENQWDLLAPLGIGPPDRTRVPVTMTVDPQIAADVAQRIAAGGVTPGTPLVVMHVSAGNPFRRWPLPAFAAVAARLVQEDSRRRVIVTSGPSERDAAAAVIGLARASLAAPLDQRVMQLGEFSLAELRALVEGAALFIGGDSGPMHVAATSRVPIVSLYGPTLPARSEPWRPPAVPALAVETHGLPCRPCEQRVCEPGDFRCLNWITPEAVVAAAQAAMRGATPLPDGLPIRPAGLPVIR